MGYANVMKLLDLFTGTGSVAKVARDLRESNGAGKDKATVRTAGQTLEKAKHAKGFKKPQQMHARNMYLANRMSSAR